MSEKKERAFTVIGADYEVSVTACSFGEIGKGVAFYDVHGEKVAFFPGAVRVMPAVAPSVTVLPFTETNQGETLKPCDLRVSISKAVIALGRGFAKGGFVSKPGIQGKAADLVITDEYFSSKKPALKHLVCSAHGAIEVNCASFRSWKGRVAFMGADDSLLVTLPGPMTITVEGSADPVTHWIDANGIVKCSFGDLGRVSGGK